MLLLTDYGTFKIFHTQLDCVAVHSTMDTQVTQVSQIFMHFDTHVNSAKIFSI